MRATQYPLRWFSFLCWILLASVCFLLTVAQPGSAQVDQGAITGLVTDSSGAVVGNAGVTLTNLDNGLVLQTTTTSTGEYTFSPVRIGNYSVSATSQGFATTTQKDLKLNVQQRLVVNLQLKPGSTSERIEVSAVAPLMQTEDASVGQVIGSHQIENQALNGRNFTFLAQLAAGVNSPQADTRGNAATGAFAANGNRPAQNNYMLDGIDNNSDTVGFPQRNQLRGASTLRSYPGVQSTDLRFQRRIRTFRRRRVERDHQVRHQQLPRRSLGIFPQRQA